MIFHKNISKGFQLTERTIVHGGNGYVQRAITPKVGYPELRFMCSARRLMVLYMCKVSQTGSESIKEFHRKYVLAPADKAANNVVVV